MEKLTHEILLLIAPLSVVVFSFLNAKKLAFAAFTAIGLQIMAASFIIFQVFAHGVLEFSYAGSMVTGAIAIKVDYLSAWMMLIISFTFLTGGWYGFHYLKKYKDQTSNLRLHTVAFVLAYTALLNICMIQNALVFLVAWEIMALSTFLLVIFEHHKNETIRAGINFLIQSHLCIVFITLAFIWAKIETGSYDFEAITNYTALHPRFGMALFGLFFIGFAFKAGFVPFHTWLPLAHPAAPSHVSGIMSGVVVKIGLFGILRMITVIHTNYEIVGFFIILFSIVTGLFGVIMAILQSNLKKLLAYSTIENIGIIGLGIGLGCLGLGTNTPLLQIAGFGGALLHMLNHSLFKSLLFFNAGTVYQSTHTLNLDSLGGLIKQIPRTAFLFLIGALAICGFPPFNGFLSEFYIYRGLLEFQSNQSLFNLSMLFSIFALVLIGGLALITFTKAFGIVFLGTKRSNIQVTDHLDKTPALLPLYLIVGAIMLVGLFPFVVSPLLVKTVGQFYKAPEVASTAFISETLTNTTAIGLYSLGFIALIALVFYLRKLFTKKQNQNYFETWGCGYFAPSAKVQYTAKSSVRAFGDLFAFVVSEQKNYDKIPKNDLYPSKRKFSTFYADIWEKYLIMPPLKWFAFLLNYFKFIQNGRIQSYVVYGLLFIVVVVIVSMLSLIKLVI